MDYRQDTARYLARSKTPNSEMDFSYLLPIIFAALPSGVKPCLPAVKTLSLVPKKIYFSIAGHIKALMDSMRQKERVKGKKKKNKRKMCGREKKEKELGPIVEAQEKELGSNDCIS